MKTVYPLQTKFAGGIIRQTGKACANKIVPDQTAKEQSDLGLFDCFLQHLTYCLPEWVSSDHQRRYSFLEIQRSKINSFSYWVIFLDF